MANDQPLLELMRREYSVAKLCVRGGEALQVAATVIAFVAVATEHTGAAYVAAAAFAGPILLLLLREIGTRYQSAGDRVRRFLLFWEGLGRKPSAEELADADVRGATLRSFDPQPRGSYYTSNLPVGKQRLSENLQESAFFTKEQAHTSMLFYGALTFLGLVASIWFAWYWLRQHPFTTDPNGGPQGAQLFSALIVFFGTGHVIQSTLAFYKLGVVGQRVFDKSAKLKLLAENVIDETELGQLLTTYEVALAKTPPLPGWSYWRVGSKLDATWRTHMVPGAP